MASTVGSLIATGWGSSQRQDTKSITRRNVAEFAGVAGWKSKQPRLGISIEIPWRLLYTSGIWRLEVEAELYGFGARGDEVRAAEGGEEVVESVFVGQVDDGEAEASLVAVAIEQVVVADGQIE